MYFYPVIRNKMEIIQDFGSVEVCGTGKNISIFKNQLNPQFVFSNCLITFNLIKKVTPKKIFSFKSGSMTYNNPHNLLC